MLTWGVLGVGPSGVPSRRALPESSCPGLGAPDGGDGGGLVPEGGGGGGLVPLGGGGGINVPLGESLGGGENGSGLEFGSKFCVKSGFLFSIWRTRQRCRAETGRSTHWSGRDEGGGGNGNKDCEMHLDVLV